MKPGFPVVAVFLLILLFQAAEAGITSSRHIVLPEAHEWHATEQALPSEAFSAAGEFLHSGQTGEVHNISPLRPRLFVRADDAKLGRGLTLSGLRTRMNHPAFRNWTGLNSEVPARGNPSAALRYLLTGERSYALDVGERLATTDIPYQEHTSTAAAVYHSAIAFDWVREALPDDMAEIICKKLVEGAEHLKSGVRSPSINHNYSIVSLYALSMAAVAIYGESAEMTSRSEEYLGLINRMLTGEHMLLETFMNKEGTWGEGNHYTPFVVYFPFLMTMRGLTTSTGTDFFSLIRNHYGNFIEPMARFVMANFRPDFTLERIGDILGTVVPTGRFMPPLLELLASEAHDPELQGQIRSFSRDMEAFFPDPLVSSSTGWMMMVCHDPDLPDQPSYKTLPLAMRFGKDTYEHIMFRNSWDVDGTLITYISGDQYTHHQHLDKGHFLIFRNGGLAVDGGGYGSPMYGDNWANYSTRTLAHNCVLVHDPEEEPREGTRGTIIYPDGGQKIQVGKQGHRNWQQFLDQKDADGLNAADVLAFDGDTGLNRYNYVMSDLGKAYGDRVVSMDRQLLYLPGANYLVVKDRIVSAKPMDKYWLLHFEYTPTIDGKLPEAGISEYPGSGIVRAERTDTLRMGGREVVNSGALFIRSMLPENRNITLVGGPGYEYYNRFADKNFPNSSPFDPVIEPGSWRMETGTAIPEKTTSFLHALEITGSDRQQMVETKYLETKKEDMAGVLFLSKDVHYVVLFGKSKEGEEQSFHRTGRPAEYRVTTTAPASHVLVEMAPHSKVKVVINGKDTGTFQTSGAGVLFFEDKGLGIRNIVVVPEQAGN